MSVVLEANCLRPAPNQYGLAVQCCISTNISFSGSRSSQFEVESDHMFAGICERERRGMNRGERWHRESN